MVILSCELIDNNGKELEKCVGEYIRQWELPEAFKAWRESSLCFLPVNIKIINILCCPRCRHSDGRYSCLQQGEQNEKIYG